MIEMGLIILVFICTMLLARAIALHKVMDEHFWRDAANFWLRHDKITEYKKSNAQADFAALSFWRKMITMVPKYD